jgi:hypothetical protein
MSTTKLWTTLMSNPNWTRHKYVHKPIQESRYLQSEGEGAQEQGFISLKSRRD